MKFEADDDFIVMRVYAQNEKKIRVPVIVDFYNLYTNSADLYEFHT